MRIAVLLEIDKTVKKNGDIIKGAENRLILDDAYKKLMQNGKQTIGSKELQFILYYLKKDGFVDVPSRGLYVENKLTIAEREKSVAEFMTAIDNKELDKKDIMLTGDIVEQIFKTVTSKKKNNDKASDKSDKNKPADKPCKKEDKLIDDKAQVTETK